MGREAPLLEGERLEGRMGVMVEELVEGVAEVEEVLAPADCLGEILLGRWRGDLFRGLTPCWIGGAGRAGWIGAAKFMRKDCARNLVVEGRQSVCVERISVSLDAMSVCCCEVGASSGCGQVENFQT